MHFKNTVSLGLALTSLGTLVTPRPATAQTVVYDNATPVTDLYLLFGPPPGTLPTVLFADDITPIAGYAGLPVTEFQFSLANVNGMDVTVTPTINFYLPDSTGNRPGSLITSVNLGPTPLAQGFYGTLTETSAAGFFKLPSGTFFAGVSFSGAPAAQLGDILPGLSLAPTVGTSKTSFFISNSAATNASSPPGYLSTGAGRGNLGWQFQVSPPAVPEASTTVSFGLLLALGMGGLVVAARRRKGASPL